MHFTEVDIVQSRSELLEITQQIDIGISLRESKVN